MPIFCDIETDGLDPSKIHVACTKEVRADGTVLDSVFTNQHNFLRYFRSRNKMLWVFHNGTSFDIPVLKKLWKADFSNIPVVDTMVVSKLLNYKKFRTHSLKEIGEYLKVCKGDYTGGWDNYSEEMLEYCVQDVNVTEAIYNYYKKSIYDPKWKEAMSLEHSMATSCYDMSSVGFKFDTSSAALLLVDVISELDELENSFKSTFGQNRTEAKRIKHRFTKSGGPMKNVQKAIDEYPDHEVITEDGEDMLVCYEMEDFNPGSPRQRIDKLWEAGWKPYEKTKGHIKNKDKSKQDHYSTYGWTCSEANLDTLPASAPQASRDLAQWLTLEGRRSSLVEWLGCVGTDSRIHGKFWHIGAWTHRMSHSSPNQANIASVWPDDKEPTSAVEEVKAKYDTKLRALFTVDEDKVLVGVDAEGIQLRVLAHYMDNDDYTNSVVSGDSSKGTDVHTMNMKALGHVCKDRDTAKTFIYAWLLGAGLPKIAQILGCTIPQAKIAVDDFLTFYPDLKKLKKVKIPNDARKGYFEGLDGRKVVCDSEHFMLAGYLQNGESTIMKTAMRIFKEDTKHLSHVHFVDLVHDEFQVECKPEDGDEVREMLCEAIYKAGVAIGVKCPMAGKGSVGKNWAETH